MALTFDDGPFIYTSHILDVLEQYNASATFFITGNNNGEFFSRTITLNLMLTSI
jgi:peptidoglycan/xylan/chitin deacetylase (PgdA/CDA1 family)